MRGKCCRSSQGGFSLVEIMIAVTIIVIMGGVVAVNVFPFLFESRVKRAQLDIATLKKAVRLFKMNESRLPLEGEWPEFLVSGSKHHRDSYIDEDQITEGQILDPWDNPYVYKKLGSKDFEIVSYGADSQPGGEDDDADISSKKNKNR